MSIIREEEHILTSVPSHRKTYFKSFPTLRPTVVNWIPTSIITINSTEYGINRFDKHNIWYFSYWKLPYILKYNFTIYMKGKQHSSIGWNHVITKWNFKTNLIFFYNIFCNAFFKGIELGTQNINMCKKFIGCWAYFI